jgi:hypothetical protein
MEIVVILRKLLYVCVCVLVYVFKLYDNIKLEAYVLIIFCIEIHNGEINYLIHFAVSSSPTYIV